MDQQQADALALLAETALHHGIDPGAPGERYQVVVHVDAAVLADPGGARPVRPRRRHARSRGNVPAPGVRREPGGDAARRGRADRRSRRPDAHDSAGDPARAAPPRPRLPVPGLRPAVRPGPSHPPLGPWRPHHALEPRDALPAPSPRRPRGGLSGGTTARRRRCGSGDRTDDRCPTSRLRPRCPTIPSDVIRARNEAAGLRLHARTACPGWLGERLDVGWAIDVLHPRAIGE